jgi:hypothetical protein
VARRLNRALAGINDRVARAAGRKDGTYAPGWTCRVDAVTVRGVVQALRADGAVRPRMAASVRGFGRAPADWQRATADHLVRSAVAHGHLAELSNAAEAMLVGRGRPLEDAAYQSAAAAPPEPVERADLAPFDAPGIPPEIGSSTV